MTAPHSNRPSYRDRADGPWLYYYLLNGFETPGGSRADETPSRGHRSMAASAELVRGYRSRRLKQSVLAALFEEYRRTDCRPMSAETYHV